MRRHIVAVLCAAFLGSASSSAPVVAQHKEKAGGQIATGVVLSSVKEIMESIIDPSADVVWNSVGTVVDRDGVHESVPKTPDEWLEVRKATVRIIEGSNLLIMPGRGAAPPGTKSETPGVELEPAEIAALIKKNRRAFDAFARALQALAVEAQKATDAHDRDQLIEVGGRMDDACEGCHQTFWYPPK